MWPIWILIVLTLISAGISAHEADNHMYPSHVRKIYTVFTAIWFLAAITMALFVLWPR
jgi:hypothetical protein